MIHARKPEHLEALHSRAPGENVLDRVVQYVPERQHTSDVRRRHDDREWWLRGSRICCEIALRQPERIPLFFSGLRFVSLGNFCHAQSSKREQRLQERRRRSPSCGSIAWTRWPALWI